MGPDEVTLEALCIPTIAASVVSIMDAVLDGKPAPIEGCKLHMVAIPKTPGIVKIEDHRSISLMSCTANIFDKILL